MTDDPLPDADNFCRHCLPTDIDPETGKPDGTAFRLRRREEYLSVNWLEYFGVREREAQIEQVRQDARKILRLSKESKFATIGVKHAKEYVYANRIEKIYLDISHQPSGKNKSHSGIFNIQPEVDLVADLLAEIVDDTFPGEK